MDSDDDQRKRRPTRMRVEYMDGGESSIDSLHSSDVNSSGDDESSPNSLPEVYAPHISPYNLLDRTKTMRPPSISSSSSSSATTSSDELFQITPPDHEVIAKEETSPEVAPITTTTTTEEVVSDNVLVVSGASSAMQSPPVQVMDRSSTADHDPYRIPAAVFETSTSVAAVDWSNASNDSLFSISIENASLAKDYHRGKAWSRRDTVRPKRELTLTPDRWSKSPSPAKSSSSPTQEVAVDDNKALKSPEDQRKNKTQGDSSNLVEQEIEDCQIKEPKLATHAESLNLCAKKDEIGAYPKHCSFAGEKKKSGRKSSRSWCLRIFPCLTWPSWCFATCCRPLCCSCKWLSCCKCRFPSCSCCSCSLAFCFCEHPCCSSMAQCCGWSSIRLAVCYICSCKPLTLLCCCVTGPNSKDQATDKQDSKGGCCSCFSCGWSCCSCTSCFSPCRSCFSCQSCCSCKSCGSCFSSGSCFPCGSSCCSWKTCSSCLPCGSCCSCKSCSPCFSCGSCYKSCSPCFSCGSCYKSCSPCFSCGSCYKSCSRPCFSCGSCCKSCGSCFTCGPCLKACRSCFSCGSCSCFTCSSSFSCCSRSWWRCRPHCC